VALLAASDLVQERDIADALLGSTAIQLNRLTGESRAVRQSDGVWNGPTGPQNTRLSAVVTVERLDWSTLATAEPAVWLNPWAAHPLTTVLPWRTHQINQDCTLTTTPASVTSAALFEFPEGRPL